MTPFSPLPSSTESFCSGRPTHTQLKPAHGCADRRPWQDLEALSQASGDESSKFYHGLISIPGVTPGLEQMSKYNAKYMLIPKNIRPVPLVLGYSNENGGYGDDGYWGHDDGTDDQCKGVENAWMQIQVLRACENVVKLPNGGTENCFYAKDRSAPVR